LATSASTRASSIVCGAPERGASSSTLSRFTANHYAI
jgi:hypothetical protein